MAKDIDPGERRDVLACLAVLAGLVVRDEDRLAEIFRGVDMGDNAFINLMVKKGIEQGRQEALAEVAEIVLDVLAGRFGEIPSDVADRIRGLRDCARLRALGRAAGRAATLDEFRAAL